MKWLFRLIFLIFIMFAGLIAAGYFASPTLTVQSSTIIDAEPDDVFPYLNDLSKFEQWSPLHALIPDAEFFYGGAEKGIGQTSVWKSPAGAYAFGTQEIVAAESPEFVQLDINLAGQAAHAFYGITIDEQSGGVIVLINTEFDLGGFPYIQRLTSNRQTPEAETEFAAALTRLKTIVEMEPVVSETVSEEPQ